jgi:error-prone DNA polymerase
LDSGEWLKEAGVVLTNLTAEERTKWNFATQGLTAGPHPVACHRSYLNRLRVQPIKELRTGKPGARIRTAGIVIARQRPPTAKGMVFLMIEDETSRIQMAMTPPVYEKYGRVSRESTLLIEGKLEGAGPGQVGDYRSVMINRLRALNPIDGGYASFPGQMAR